MGSNDGIGDDCEFLLNLPYLQIICQYSKAAQR